MIRWRLLSPLLFLLLAQSPLHLVACDGGTSTRLHPRRPPLPPVKLKGLWYEIKAGQTIQQIAQQHGVLREDIEELNGLNSKKLLVVGQKIFIPLSDTKDVPPGLSISTSNPPSSSRPRATEHPSLASGRFIWPVPTGKLSSSFGLRQDRRPHEGIDIAASEGSPVLAAAKGLVIYAGAGVRGYGNLILIRHADGLVTVYAHNRRNLVTEGTNINQGQQIAEVGRTGRTSGSHLHFEIRKDEIPQDPLRYVRP